MNSNTTNKTHAGPKRVRTQEPEEEQETQKSSLSSTPSSPTKAAKNAIEMAVCVAPYKPKTTSPPFRPPNHHCPLQTICQKVNHATNRRGHEIYPTLRQGNRFQNHPVSRCEGGRRESVLPRATDTTS